MIEKLKSITPALVTALKKDGGLDEAGQRNVVSYMLKAGMKTLFVLGYCGEGRALSRAERRRVVEITREEAGKDTLLIAGAMGDSTQIIQEYCLDAIAAGADMTLMTPTDFFYLTDEELKGLFVKLADEAKAPIMIYNAPENHHYVNPAMMLELADHPNIMALKQTSGIDKVEAMLQSVGKRDDFIMVSGDEFVFLPALAVGVEGFIMGGPGNMMPKKCIGILNDFRAGDYARAQSEYMNMIAFTRELYGMPYPMAMPQIKAVMEINGVCGRWMKHPVKAVANEDMPKVEALLKRYGY